MFLVVFKKHQMEITDPYSPLLGVSSESEKNNTSHFWKCITWKHNFSQLFWTWNVDFGGGEVCAFEASEEPLLSQPYWEEPLVQWVQALPRNSCDTEESFFFMIVNRLKRGRAHTGGAWELEHNSTFKLQFDATKRLMALLFPGHCGQNLLLC